MPLSPSEEPIPFITLPNWVKAATVCGFNIEPIFARLGIQADLLHLEEATVSPPLLGQAMEACVAASRVQHFPFVLGETFAFDYLPDIGTFLATSPTLRDALRALGWVRELIHPMIHFRLDEDAQTAALVLQGGSARTGQERYFIESVFAAVARFGRLLTGDPEPFSCLRFRHAPPDDADRYRSYFRAPVCFAQPANALELARTRLDAPLEGGFERLHRQAERRVAQLLAQLPRRAGLVAAIELALERSPSLLGQGIAGVAQQVGLHPRTLQRRLHAEGEAFGALLGRVRYRLALRALQQPELDVETISEQLGFSDRRSFTRAFHRWSGVSPSSFRQRREA